MLFLERIETHKCLTHVSHSFHDSNCSWVEKNNSQLNHLERERSRAAGVSIKLNGLLQLGDIGREEKDLTMANFHLVIGC